MLQPVTPDFAASADQQANETPVRLTLHDSGLLKKMLKDVGERSIRDQIKGGGGTMGDSDRITRLETHFEYIQRDLIDLKTGQQKIGDVLGSISVQLASLPTKTDLSSWRLQWVAVCVGAIALIVGGIIGGLAWIKPDSPPIIIRTDALQPPSDPAANNRPTPATPDVPAPRPQR